MRQIRLLKEENNLIDNLCDAGIDIIEIIEKEEVLREESPLDNIESDNYHSSLKVVKSGSLLEIYRFGRDISLGRKIRHIKTEEEKPKTDKGDSLGASARRSKRMIKRLIKANSFLWFRGKKHLPYLPITLTLTFKENITDLKEANYEFTKFIRRLNYEVNQIEKQDLKLSNLKYLAVYELQERGAVHYHVIFFNLPYINNIYKRMYDIWNQGRIRVGGKDKRLTKIKSHKSLEKIIDYFTKYIQKSIYENKNPRQKKYIASKGLLKPLESSFVEVVNLVKSKLPESSLKYHYDGESEYNKKTRDDVLIEANSFMKWFNYSMYDLSSFPEADDDIDRILSGHSLDDIAF